LWGETISVQLGPEDSTAKFPSGLHESTRGESTEKRRRALLADPEKFILHYFSHKIAKLEDFHKDLIHTALNHSRSLILYPAAHGKTTLISTILPIYALCCDPNIRIIIIARNYKDASAIMNAIHYELLDNQDLVEDFGPFHDPDNKIKPWSVNRITIKKSTRRDPRATIEIFGSGGNLLGKRADWVICDDVVTEKNSATDVQRETIKEWFNLGVSTVPEWGKSRLTVVGTLFDPQDLYHDIIELRSPDTGENIYAIRHHDAIVDDEKQETLWPEKWPWARLMIEKASIGTLQFNKRYRNVAVDPSRMVFREEYIRGGYANRRRYPGCIDKNYTIGELDPSWRVACGFDPAVGASRSSKFCALLAIAQGSCIHHEKCYWVVDISRDQLTLPQQMNLVLETHKKYDAVLSRVEANSYQAGLYQAIEAKMVETGEMFRVEPHYTSRTNKPDPETGVQSMSRWFEDGKVHIPWRELSDQHRMQILVDELIIYPSGRTGATSDTVMAFWFAWKALEETMPKYASFNRLKKPLLRKNPAGKRNTILNPHYRDRHIDHREGFSIGDDVTVPG